MEKERWDEWKDRKSKHGEIKGTKQNVNSFIDLLELGISKVSFDRHCGLSKVV
jgi:hypothetical protein